MRTQTVAIIAYDGAQAIDITGCAEVLGIANHMAGGSAYRVSVVSPDGADIATSWGMRK